MLNLKGTRQLFVIHLIFFPFGQENKSLMDLEKNLSVPLRGNHANSGVFVQDELHSLWLMLFSRSLIVGHEKYNKTKQKKIKVDEHQVAYNS